MSAPDFLNSAVIPFYYTQTTGITDVNTIISDTRTALVTNLSWTEPSTALFVSPVDSGGKFIDILLTRIAATNLEFRVRDYRGATLATRRIQIDSPVAVNYFANKFGITIESLRATPEIFRGTLLDPSPDTLSDVDNRIACSGYRVNNDGVDGAGSSTGNWFVFDSGVATTQERMLFPFRDSANVDRLGQTGAGTFLYKDMYLRITQSGVVRFTGRVYQSLVGDASLTFGTDKTIPIDDAGSTGVFRVIGLATAGNSRQLCRKA